MTKFYKRERKQITSPTEVGFSFKKELIFDPNGYNSIEWQEKLDRLQSQNFNRIKIPNFTYEMVDNKIFFDIEFIKGIQLSILEWFYWCHIIKEDLVETNDDWGFLDFKPENFIIEENTETLFLVDFDDYRFVSRKNKIESFETIQKYNEIEVKGLIKHLKNKDIEEKPHDFWKSQSL